MILKILTARSGRTRTAKSLSILATLPSLCPLSSYSGPIWSFARPGVSQCSSRAWRICSWTLVSYLRLSLPQSSVTPLAWTRVLGCTLSNSLGGSQVRKQLLFCTCYDTFFRPTPSSLCDVSNFVLQPCLSPCWSSSMMSAERPFSGNFPLGLGLRERPTTNSLAGPPYFAFCQMSSSSHTPQAIS